MHVVKVKEDLLKKGVDVDRVTEALLKGANPEDGGRVGIAFQCIGNRDCFMSAVATLIIAKRRRGDRRKAILRLARKLRRAIVITGIKYMELFLGDQYDFMEPGPATARKSGKIWQPPGGPCLPDWTTVYLSTRGTPHG
ncbi:unnamed protein product [Sphacelaria rigidula]